MGRKRLQEVCGTRPPFVVEKLHNGRMDLKGAHPRKRIYSPVPYCPVVLAGEDEHGVMLTLQWAQTLGRRRGRAGCSLTLVNEVEPASGSKMNSLEGSVRPNAPAGNRGGLARLSCPASASRPARSAASTPRPR